MSCSSSFVQIYFNTEFYFKSEFYEALSNQLYTPGWCYELNLHDFELKFEFFQMMSHVFDPGQLSDSHYNEIFWYIQISLSYIYLCL